MAVVTVRELIEAGVHFGHQASRWNPRMAQYIFGKKNEVHIIDVRETVRGLLQACAFLEQIAAEGQDILIVGTKRQAKSEVMEASRKVECPHVVERWLGGTLTNFRTVRQRLKRLEDLERIDNTPGVQVPKKLQSRFAREKRKISRNLGGVRKMERLPGALIVIDPRREKNAVKEGNRLGIPVVALTDTDSDPTVVDFCVPGNDDAMRSIRIVLAKLGEAFLKGRRKAKAQRGILTEVAAPAPPPPPPPPPPPRPPGATGPGDVPKPKVA